MASRSFVLKMHSWSAARHLALIHLPSLHLPSRRLTSPHFTSPACTSLHLRGFSSRPSTRGTTKPAPFLLWVASAHPPVAATRRRHTPRRVRIRPAALSQLRNLLNLTLLPINSQQPSLHNHPSPTSVRRRIAFTLVANPPHLLRLLALCPSVAVSAMSTHH